MEITRPFKPFLASQVDAYVQARAASPDPKRKAQENAPAASMPLEELHAELNALPEVDLDKVNAVKQALQRGEINLDMGSLSRSMMAFHGGSAE